MSLICRDPGMSGPTFRHPIDPAGGGVDNGFIKPSSCLEQCAANLRALGSNPGHACVRGICFPREMPFDLLFQI